MNKSEITVSRYSCLWKLNKIICRKTYSQHITYKIYVFCCCAKSKSKIFTIWKLNYVKINKAPPPPPPPLPLKFCFNSESGNIKRIYSAIYCWSKPRAGAIMLNFWGSSIFFLILKTNIFFAVGAPWF